MAALREKEAARHEAFRAYVDPYIPADLQGQLGLLLAPPLCEVNIPASPGGCLPEVTMEEIQASPREARPSQLVTAVFKDWLPPGQPPNKVPLHYMVCLDYHQIVCPPHHPSPMLLGQGNS